MANRVEPFSGAVGRKFTVTMTAEPADLRAGDTLLLTVRVAAEGPWHKPPSRPDLRRHEKYARFPRSFHIDHAGDQRDPAGDAWEFVYRLRPLSEEVKEVPRLPLVYYRPGQGYQTIGAPAIKLTVRPRAEVVPKDVQGSAEPDRVPDHVLQITEGPAVLRHDSPPTAPGPALFALVLLTPLVLCACWYLTWQWLCPEAARVAHQRRSRAARDALHRLRRAGRAERDLMAQQTAAVLADYLRQRFDVPAAEPTPAEVADHLARAGVADETAARMADFFRSCDAARFAAMIPPDSEDLVQRARDLILTLEAAPCLPQAS